MEAPDNLEEPARSLYLALAACLMAGIQGRPLDSQERDDAYAALMMAQDGNRS